MNEPIFIRMPKPGQTEPHTGLTRTALFDLIRSNKIRSHTLRNPAAKRGVRVVDLASLVSFIRGCPSH